MLSRGGRAGLHFMKCSMGCVHSITVLWGCAYQSVIVWGVNFMKF